MKLSKLIVASLTGTAAMTLFSEFLARKEKKRFNEPKLLAHLYSRLFHKPYPTKEDKVAGYLLHYVPGIIFSYFFIKYYHNTSKNHFYIKELAMGAAAGLTGISIWQLTFKLHKNPPALHVRDFYVQLIIAHLILSVTVYEVYRKID